MRIVFKNSTVVFAIAKWTATGRLIKVSPSDVTSVNLPEGVKVYGRNLVDISKLKYRTILNDEGIEITDSSSYFDQLIPNFGGMTLRANYKMSRVYFYDESKTLFFRFATNKASFTVPSEYNGKKVAYVKIQTAALNQNAINSMIVTRDEDAEPTEFESFKSNTAGEIYSPYSWVWADDLREIEITSK